MARILVVDDDLDILKLAKAVLTHESHVVFTAVDAIQAMDFLHTHAIDLMVSDANMPHYSGFELAQTVRNDSKFADLPIAMLTGLREKKDIEKAIKAGVDDYIIKPLDPLILIQKIDSILQRRPPKDHPQIHLSTDDPKAHGLIFMDMALVSISEIAVQFELGGELELDRFIEISCPFFLEELGELPPPLKVVEKEKRGSKWLYTLSYMGAKESYLQKVRKWIFSHGSHRRAS